MAADKRSPRLTTASRTPRAAKWRATCNLTRLHGGGVHIFQANIVGMHRWSRGSEEQCSGQQPCGRRQARQPQLLLSLGSAAVLLRSALCHCAM